MKNSPHKFKHLMKKAYKEAEKEMLREKLAQKQTRNATSQLMDDFLRVLNTDSQKKALSKFILQLERRRFWEKKHSKRSTPGEVINEHPFTNIPHNTDKTLKVWLKPSVEKSKRTAEKILRSQWKKAA